MPDPKKTDPAATDATPKDSAKKTGVPFLMLLTLTTQGRNQGENAAQNLTPARAMLEELGGRASQVAMVYGQYDAFIAGVCPNQDTLTSFVAYINEQGYFSTQTMIGVKPETFVPSKHHG